MLCRSVLTDLQATRLSGVLALVIDRGVIFSDLTENPSDARSLYSFRCAGPCVWAGWRGVVAGLRCPEFASFFIASRDLLVVWGVGLVGTGTGHSPGIRPRWELRGDSVENTGANAVCSGFATLESRAGGAADFPCFCRLLSVDVGSRNCIVCLVS